MHVRPPEPGRSHHGAELLLRVTRLDGTTDELYLAAGLTIGRTLANTVVLADDESVDRTHARVEVDADGTAHLRCVEPDGCVQANGSSQRELTLTDGVGFRIGRTEFDCVTGQRDHNVHSGRLETSCPFCGSTAVSRGGQAARTCASCHESILPVQFDPSDPVFVLVPVTCGAFRLKRYVARGGMGLVFQGSDAQGGLVAIKLLWPGAIADAHDAHRFAQEVAMLARVRHQHVVKLLDHGTAGRYDYLALEWIDGPDLRQVITTAHAADELTDFATAFRWLGQVTKGLAAIHAVGIVHRDLKPSNILIGPDGAARIADLGIARQMNAEQTAFTTNGQASGTFEYMAPEQCRAPDALDGRADLYALGATFYELLTGSRPIGSWRPASNANPSVPKNFDAILGRLMEPMPEDRYGDVYELLSALSTVRTAPRSLPLHGTEFSVADATVSGPIITGRDGWSLRPRLQSAATTIRAIRDRYFMAEALANVGARSGVLWGTVLLGTVGIIVVVPTALIGVMIKQDFDPLSLIWVGIAFLIGVGCSGFIGAIWGAIVGVSGRRSDAIQPLSLAKVFSLIYGTVFQRWHALRSAKVVSGPTDLDSSVADPVGIVTPFEQNGLMESASISINSTLLHDSPLTLNLIPLSGEKTSWKLILADDVVTVIDSQGRKWTDFAYALAEERFDLTTSVLGRRGLSIKDHDGRLASFRPKQRTIHAIRAYLDVALVRQGLEALRAIRSGGCRRHLWGDAMRYLSWIGKVGLEIGASILDFFKPSGGWWFSSREQLRPIGERVREIPGRPERSFIRYLGYAGASLVGLTLSSLFLGFVGSMYYFSHQPANTHFPPHIGQALPAAAKSGPSSPSIFPIHGGQPIQPRTPTLTPISEASQRIRAAEVAIRKGQYDEAIAACDEALHLGQLFPLAYGHRGVARALKRDFSGARADGNRAVASDPQSAAAHAYRGRVLMELEDNAAALADCQRAIELDPNLAIAYAYRSLIRLGNGEDADALADGERAVTLASDLPEAYLSRGASRLFRGQIEGALVDCDEAIRRAPASLAAHELRAMIHLTEGEFDQAIGDTSKFIELCPMAPEGWIHRGTAYTRKGEFERAIVDFDKAIELGPKVALAFNKRGRAFLGKDNFDRALDDFDEAIRLDPKFSYAYSSRALVRLERGDADGGRADCDRAIEFDPANVEAHFLRGSANNTKGEHGRAILDFDEALRLSPTLDAASNGRGVAFYSRGEIGRAFADFDTAVRGEPGNPKFLADRGLARQAQGDLNGALTDYREALQLGPPDPERYRELVSSVEAAKRTKGQ